MKLDSYQLLSIRTCRERSGSVVEYLTRDRGFDPHLGHCVVVLEQDIFILAKYWLYPGRTVPVLLKDCWLDVKNQTNNQYMLFWLGYIFLWKLILVFKTVFMYSLIIPMKTAMFLHNTRWQEYWNGESWWLFLLPFINMLLFREISTFAFNFDWFTWNYKDQTDSKLPESGFCTHIILKTHVL